MLNSDLFGLVLSPINCQERRNSQSFWKVQGFWKIEMLLDTQYKKFASLSCSPRYTECDSSKSKWPLEGLKSAYRVQAPRLPFKSWKQGHKGYHQSPYASTKASASFIGQNLDSSTYTSLISGHQGSPWTFKEMPPVRAEGFVWELSMWHVPLWEAD